MHLTIGLPSESAPSIRTCIDSSPSSPPSKSSLASLIYMSISDSRASLSSSLKCSIQSIPSSVLPDSKYVRNPPIPISDTHSFLFLSSAIRILPFGPASHIHSFHRFRLMCTSLTTLLLRRSFARLYIATSVPSKMKLHFASSG